MPSVLNGPANATPTSLALFDEFDFTRRNMFNIVFSVFDISRFCLSSMFFGLASICSDTCAQAVQNLRISRGKLGRLVPRPALTVNFVLSLWVIIPTYAQASRRLIHSLFDHFLSVMADLYSLSTGPTISTISILTSNNKEAA